MTNIEQILVALNEAGLKGMTAVDLHDKLRIPKNTLGTILWELKERDQFIRKVGGNRGRYRYGLTELGREALPYKHKDPEDRLTQDFTNLPADSGFTELAKVAGRFSEIKKFRSFLSWLVYDKKLDFGGSKDDLLDRIYLAYLEHNGIDAATFQKERESLELLLSA